MTLISWLKPFKPAQDLGSARTRWLLMECCHLQMSHLHIAIGCLSTSASPVMIILADGCLVCRNSIKHAAGSLASYVSKPLRSIVERVSEGKVPGETRFEAEVRSYL